jgi:beta-lactamase regulating signal transducer with metallopeptidase domain
MLLMTVLALHWYNPFVYLLVRKTEYAMELACDERRITQQRDIP